MPDEVTEQLRLHRWCWKSGGAVIGLCAGVIAPLAGALLTVIAWCTGPQWHGFSIQRYGTVLFFLTCPLLVFGAHCLDLLDKEDLEAKGRHLEVSQSRYSFEKETDDD